jgi:topoisomerase IA-like protein
MVLKKELINKIRNISPEESRTIHLEGEYGDVDIKVGRFGPYV